MNKFQKILSLCLALCLFAVSFAAMAEGADAAPEATAVAATGVDELADDTVIATVNGENVTWADAKPYYDDYVAQYGSYYDLTDPANVKLFRSVAMEQAITMSAINQAAKANGLDNYTQDELDKINADSDAIWDDAMQSYVTNYANLGEDATDDDRAKALADAEANYAAMGYSKDKLRTEALAADLYNRVKNFICKDIAVTDEDVQAEYDAKVAADKTLYENDISAYEEYVSNYSYMQQYSAYYGTDYDLDPAWYKPAGYRAVKHILLPVDSELMTTYTDLQARYEEQMTKDNAEEEPTATDETAEATEAPEATPETPVTQADIDTAKAAILASKQDTIDEINQKIADGADFDALILEYAVDADGNPTDQGMVNEPYKTSGYEVARESTGFVPEFVAAAFSVDNIGDVSAPYISDYGIHIVKYIGDVEGGPIAMTDAQREEKRAALLKTKQDDAMNAWMGTATIEYTGVIPSMAELQAEEDAAAANETIDESEVPADEAVVTEEPAVTDAPAE